MKGRSPFMRHVSRTQRITLDLFFDRINFDLKIQIRYVDTKNQLSDILTKGSFSEDVWNNLLRLKDIMTVCPFPRSHFSHIVSDFFKNSRSMSKRGQEQKFAEGSAVTESKPMSSRSVKTRPIILMSEASTVQVVEMQEVTPIWSWAKLKVLGEHRECRMMFPRTSDKGQRLNWTRLTMSDTPKWKYNKMFGALKLKNEIELFLPTTAFDNGQRNRWVRQTSKQNS